MAQSVISGAFSVTRQAGAFAISADVTVNVPTVGSAAVRGAFSRDAQGRTLYELSGNIAFNPAGYDFGTATFRAPRGRAPQFSPDGRFVVYRIGAPVADVKAAEKAAKQLFAFSILYLFLLFAVLLAEHGFGMLVPVPGMGA